MTDFKIDGFRLRGDLKIPQKSTKTKRTIRFLSFLKPIDVDGLRRTLEVLNVEPASVAETKLAIREPSLLFHIQEENRAKIILMSVSVKEDFHSMFVIEKGHVVEQHPRVLGGISPCWVIPVVSNW